MNKNIFVNKNFYFLLGYKKNYFDIGIEAYQQILFQKIFVNFMAQKNFSESESVIIELSIL